MTLRKAVSQFQEAGLAIRAVSRFFETPCFPSGAGPDYVNAALCVESTLAPGRILNRLHDIERRFQRQRDARWGMRTLDLDLIATDNKVLPDLVEFRRWLTLPQEEQTRSAPSDLILPHPRLQDRAFVLVPLADIAPDWVHPVLGKSVRDMLDDLPASDTRPIRPI